MSAHTTAATHGVSSALLAALDRASSVDDGLRLLASASATLDAGVAQALDDAADQAGARGDRPGAADLRRWAIETRALIKLRQRDATPSPADFGAGVAAIAALQPDEPFIELLERRARSATAAANAALSAQPPDTRVALEAINVVGTEAVTISFAAHAAENASWMARSELLTGMALLGLAQVHAEGPGVWNRDLTAQARDHLEACVREPSAPLEVRAQAESSLAISWTQEDEEERSRHLAQAEQLGRRAQPRDHDFLRAIRLQQAVQPHKRGDREALLALHEANIEESELALTGETSPLLAIEVVGKTSDDYYGAVEAAAALAGEDRGAWARTVELMEAGKGRAFLQTLSFVGSSGARSPWLDARRRRLLERINELGAQLSMLPPESAGLRVRELERLRHDLGVTEHRRKAGRQVWITQWRPCSLARTAAAVPHGGAAVSMYWLERRLLVAAIGEEGLLGTPATVALPADDLFGGDRLVRELVDAVVAIRLRGDYRSADELQGGLGERMEMFWPDHWLRDVHRWTIEPVADQLMGRSPIVVLPHHMLRQVPFHALPDAQGRALVEHAAVSYAPGAALMAPFSERGARQFRKCFAAGVRADHGGPAGARAEAELVAQHFRTTPAPATRAALLKGAAGADVVHLACHHSSGNVDTAFQGLELEDGLLTQRDVGSLQLDGALVVLSACGTAEADAHHITGAEMAGLVGAFLQAGASAVAATMWPLPDAAAAATVHEFYNALAEDGVGAAEALRRAQTAIKAHARFDHPYFWAPLALWGNPLAGDDPR